MSKVAKLSPDVTLYEFRHPEGAPLPPATAGAHIDVVVAPEFFRQYSLCSDPADDSCYQIAVLREDAGRGGSRLMHRVFTEGRRVFISPPINHFPVDETAQHTLLLGGGIGITPMIAMAHRLWALGRDFAMHYSFHNRDTAAFLPELAAMPWAAQVHLHCSADGTRAELAKIITAQPGCHVYTCGPDAYMAAVAETARARGFAEDHIHMEYFSVPERPEYVNAAFNLRLPDGRLIPVSAEQSASDALVAAGIHVDVKCADGLCGVCKCKVLSGAVEHRDFVLSQADRAGQMILCQSRAAKPDETLEIDLG